METGTKSNRNQEMDFASIQQENLGKTPAPRAHQAKGGSSKARVILSNELPSLSNQETSMEGLERQDTHETDYKGTGDRTTGTVACQLTLKKDLRPDEEPNDHTKDENGISLHGPRSQGARTLLEIHQEPWEGS